MVFMIAEALVGAGLVLLELVAENDSIARAMAISVHLVNTFLLLACLSLTAWWSSGGKSIDLAVIDPYLWLFGLAFIGMLVLGMSGALTALGDTLFPASSLTEGFLQDFSPSAHFLIRLRLLHPTIAILVGIYLIVISGLIMFRHGSQEQKYLGRVLTLLVVVQLLAGLVNVYLLAPVWMQLVHLLFSNLIWITLVIFGVVTLSSGTRERPVEGIGKEATLPERSSI